MRDLDRAAVKAKGAARRTDRNSRIDASAPRRPKPMREHMLQDWAA